MENKRQVSGSSSSSSLDHIFGPKVSSSSSSSSTGLFGTIFPPPSVIIPLIIARDKAVAQGIKTKLHPLITMKQWNLAISAHLSTMEARKIILQGPTLHNISKRMMILVETILVVVPQEAIGGRARFITNILIQKNPKFLSNTLLRKNGWLHHQYYGK